MRIVKIKIIARNRVRNVVTLKTSAMIMRSVIVIVIIATQIVMMSSHVKKRTIATMTTKILQTIAARMNVMTLVTRTTLATTTVTANVMRIKERNSITIPAIDRRDSKK